MGKLYLGTIGWSYNFWKGNFYPNKIPQRDYLAHYATQFNTVEVDNTFYRIPTQKTMINWKKQTPINFLFSLKFPQVITHIKKLKDCQNETALFFDRVEMLEEKIGALLLQFPPSFGIDHLTDLQDFLRKLPTQYRYVIEMRNKDWLNQTFYSLLTDHNAALAWVDNPKMRQNSEITSDFLYIRWEGDRRKVKGNLGKIEANKEKELALWTDKISPFLDEQTNVFGYFGKYYSGYPPSDILLLKNLLKQ